MPDLDELERLLAGGATRALSTATWRRAAPELIAEAKKLREEKEWLHRVLVEAEADYVERGRTPSDVVGALIDQRDAAWSFIRTLQTVLQQIRRGAS